MLKYLKNERGTILILVGVAMVMLMGFTALAVDVGLMVTHKSALQNACDAAALAGAQELPSNTVAAKTIAEEYALNNGAANVTIQFSEANHKIIVEAEELLPFFFAPILGIDETTIRSRAVAVVAPLNSIHKGLRPFGVAVGDADNDGRYDNTDDDDGDGIPNLFDEDDDNNGVLDINEDHDGDGTLNKDDPDYIGLNMIPGQDVILKEGAPDGMSGNFGALSLDGEGASGYYEDILNGSDTGYSVGQPVPTKPGNMPTQTVNKVNELINACKDGCTWDSYEDDCSRIITIVFVDDFDINGASEDPIIVGFAKFFLKAIDYVGKGSNGHIEIKGIFIEQVDAGAANPTQVNYGAMGIKLIE